MLLQYHSVIYNKFIWLSHEIITDGFSCTFACLLQTGVIGNVPHSAKTLAEIENEMLNAQPLPPPPVPSGWPGKVLTVEELERQLKNGSPTSEHHVVTSTPCVPHHPGLIRVPGGLHLINQSTVSRLLQLAYYCCPPKVIMVDEREEEL